MVQCLCYLQIHFQPIRRQVVYLKDAYLNSCQHITTNYYSSCSYIQDEEVQPAPGVGEVLLQSKGDPLKKHLQQEQVGAHLVHGAHHHL